MTGSSPSTASRHSLSAAAPALAPFHPEAGVDTSRGLQSLEKDHLLFGKISNPAVPSASEIAFGPFRLRPTQFLLLEGDKPVRLGSRALQILVVLLERPGELISKHELMGRVWPDIFVEPANLTVHISALRRTLRDGRDGNRFLINIPGRGYSFVAPVEVRHEPDTGADNARQCAAGSSSRLRPKAGWRSACRQQTRAARSTQPSVL
jgi:DNA-binding winged helix-turn-helix (wHTH) protein